MLALALAAAPPTLAPPPEISHVLAGISPDALRGDLSFLASDLLEGRGTPSRGLDLAAEYIAAQFRCAGLAPAAGHSYFQTAHMLRLAPPAGFELIVRKGAHTLAVPKDQAAVVSLRGLALNDAPIYKMRTLADLKTRDLQGKVLAVAPSTRQDLRTAARAAAALKPAALLVADAAGDLLPPRLIDPDEERQVFGGIPRLGLRDGKALAMLRSARAGDTALTVSIKMSAPVATPVQARNVIGLLRGSDAVLRDQYILLTAHYDHLGMEASGHVFHGANDDGSGTVSVIAIARALAALPVPPKRSVVFMTFFGEEEGSLGSRYYAYRPLFPLDRTVADLNLEQLGRTDSNQGREVSNATLTGFAYSSVARTLQQAGQWTGVKVYQTANGDQYFDRSDNQIFARRGIPAHTIVVAFQYPDYHAVDDTWQKIDYRNMAKVDRMIALGTILLADSPDPPRWNRANRQAARYLSAR